MKKELHKRFKNNDLLFKCCCGGNHFVEFHYDIDKDWIEYWISIINDGAKEGFFRRIKNALRYVFKNDSVRWVEVGLNSRDLKRIKKHIDKYLEELKK